MTIDLPDAHDVELARAMVTDVLARIAPEVDLDRCDASADLADEIDLDSMDFLTLVTHLSQRIGRDIPERDYSRLTSLEALIGYIAERLE